MPAFCYAYYYGMPNVFDVGSAVPAFDLAVQSLGETFLSDDGKYYQEDIVGTRNGILGGGVANFDGLRSIAYANLSGVTITDFEGTATPSIVGNTIEFTSGKAYYMLLSDGTKTYFNAGSGSTIFDLSDNGNHGTLATGSEVGFQTFEDGIYSYLDNYGYSKIGEAYLPALESDKTLNVFDTPLDVTGRVKYNAEIQSSVLKLNGTTNSVTMSELVDLAENEDFKYTFKFSLSGTANDYEVLINIKGSNGGQIICYTSRRGDAAFFIKKIDETFETLQFSTQLLRDGTTYTGFIQKTGSNIIYNLNGEEVSQALTANTKAIVDGVLTIGSGGDISSTFCNCTLFDIDITDCFKSNFSEYGGSTIYNLYENCSDGALTGSNISAWELSSYQNPKNNSEGYTYSTDHYIPASETNIGKDVQGNDLQVLGVTEGLNGSESCELHPVVYELIEHENTMATMLRYSESGGVYTAIPYLYADITANREGVNSEFALIKGNVKSKHTTYKEPLTGDDLIDAVKYFDIHEDVTQDGVIVTQDGETVVI